MVKNLSSLTGQCNELCQKNETQCESIEISSTKLIRASSSAQETDYEELDLARKLRRALINLGPTFIKVGQQLSIRPDLVSPIVLYELQRLCDAVPPFECSIAMRVLADELESTQNSGQEHSKKRNNEDTRRIILKAFDEMPTLVASASLGQVYKGKLRPHDAHSEPEHVAIKIQRPDMLETVTLDLFLLVTYGKTVDKICSFLTNQIPYHEAFLNGFSQGAFMELNYLHEAANQTFFRNEIHSRFNGQKRQWGSIRRKLSQFCFSFSRAHQVSHDGPDKVIVPKVYSEYTTERILVTEWINGKPLAQSPPEQIRDLIKRVEQLETSTND
jgi:aarF domain-containing kinase